MTAAPWLVAAALAVGACGPKIAFGLTARDNDTAALDRALAQRRLPAGPSPINASGAPRLFAVTGGAAHAIVAFDLAASRPLWTAAVDVQSRISVGGDFIVEREGAALVARDQAHGAPRWSVALAGTFVGAAADRERAYVVTLTGPTARLAAYDGATGHELWKADAAGALGAPAAQGGVVYVPFLSQWLAIVDGATGAQRTRIRGLDEEIAMLRVTSTAAYFGSRQGVFLLDHRSASGKRAEASYRQVAIPPELERASYGRDAYSATQVTYSAADRARVLWSALPTAQGAMQLAGDGYAIHYFRYVLGFAASGAVGWAYSQPRVELVASDDTGGAIVAVSAAGDVIALDRATGAVRARGVLGVLGVPASGPGAAPVLGATFDADGWAPSGAAGPGDDATAALIAIARDRDARFDRVKDLAIRAVGGGTGGSGGTGGAGGSAGSGGSGESGGPGGADAPSGAPALDPAQVTAALAALQRHLDAPATPVPDLVQVIAAMAALGHGAERAALCAQLTLYHADDGLGADPSWQQAIVQALAPAAGDPVVRDTLQRIAADHRTQPGLATRIAAAAAHD